MVSVTVIESEPVEVIASDVDGPNEPLIPLGISQDVVVNQINESEISVAETPSKHIASCVIPEQSVTKVDSVVVEHAVENEEVEVVVDAYDVIDEDNSVAGEVEDRITGTVGNEETGQIKLGIIPFETVITVVVVTPK